MNITKDKQSFSTTPFEYRGIGTALKLSSGIPRSGQGIYFNNAEVMSPDAQVLSDGLWGQISTMNEVAAEIHDNELSYTNYLNWVHNHRKLFVSG